VNEVHFELFLKKSAKIDWALVEVSSDREKLVSAAKSLAGSHDQYSVRLIKETYNAGTGQFSKVAIFTAGPFGDEDFDKKQKDQGKLQCFRPDDFYSLQSRITIGRLLEDFLKRHAISAVELIHRSDKLAALDDDGTVLQHAIQKYALVKQSGKDEADHSVLHANIRQLYGLVEKACAIVHKDEEDKKFPDLTPSNFAKTIEALKNTATKDYRLRGGVAKYISGGSGWHEKIEMLSDLLDGLPSDPELRKTGASVVDLFLSDFVLYYATIPDIAGHHQHLRDALTVMAGVFIGRSKGEGEGGGAQKYFRPTKYCLKGDLPQTKQNIGKRVLKEIEGKHNLHSGFLQDEVVAARKLADLIVWGQGPDVSIDSIKEAFRIRCKRFVLTRSLEDFVKKIFNQDEKVERLLAFSENIVGEQNKIELSKFIVKLIRTPQFERFFKDTEQHLINRLMRLAGLQRMALKAELSEAGSQRVAEELDSVSMRIATDEQFLASVVKRPMQPIDRAILMLDLCQKGVITRGNFFDAVKRIVWQNLPERDDEDRDPNSPEVKTVRDAAYLQKVEKLKSLLNKMNLFQEGQEAA